MAAGITQAVASIAHEAAPLSHGVGRVEAAPLSRGAGAVEAAATGIGLHAADPSKHVVVVGGGPTGMASALGLARRGISSTVLEKYGETATRGQLLNLNPAALDNLSALGCDPVIAKMQTVEQTVIADGITGEVSRKGVGNVPLEPDPTRSIGSMDALIDAYHGVDIRPTGRISIGTLENAFRDMVRTGTFELDGRTHRYADFIDMRFDTNVSRVEQDAAGVRAIIAGQGGAEEAVEGALLLNASGGRSIPGMHMHPETGGEVAYFIGGEFAGSPHTTTRITRELGDDQLPYQTIGMTTPDKSIVWAQVPHDVHELPVELQRGIVRRRAIGVGIESDLVHEQRMMPVRMQLGHVEHAVEGRVVGVGDTNRSPYFPTSTGAASGLSVDAPLAIDAIDQVLNHGAHVHDTLARYDRAIVEANEQLAAVSGAQMSRDLAVPMRVMGNEVDLRDWLAHRDEGAHAALEAHAHMVDAARKASSHAAYEGLIRASNASS